MQSIISHTVLVVDDNLVNLHTSTSILEGAGYTVITGINSDEALEMINNQSPDIILLDVMMPGMDGFSLCRKLKKD
ncbi:MAG TPA: response regulator, partial [Desulfobacterales bacterium]|nr:response regulator [Desulfobacterales bacterium]